MLFIACVKHRQSSNQDITEPRITLFSVFHVETRHPGLRHPRVDLSREPEPVAVLVRGPHGEVGHGGADGHDEGVPGGAHEPHEGGGDAGGGAGGLGQAGNGGTRFQELEGGKYVLLSMEVWGRMCLNTRIIFHRTTI